MTHLDHAQTIESLQRERDMLRALIDSLPDGLYLKDLEGHFLVANKAACARRGVHHEAELLGKTDFENIPTMTASCHNEQGIPIGILGMERLHENSTEARYRIITELISDYAYCCRFELDGSIVGEWITADSYFRTTGYAFQELANYRLYHPDDEMRSQQDVERVRQGETVESDYRILTKSGEERWVHIHRQPVWDDQQNRVVRFYGVAQDITERKQAEEALRQSEERYRMISELVSDYAFENTIYPDNTYKNEWILEQAFQRVTGYEFQEVYRTTRLYQPTELARVQADIQRTLRGEVVENEYQIVTKSGEQRWIYIKRFPVWDDTENRVVRYYGVAQDITERKQAEAAVRQSEERYRMISELVSDYAFENTIYPDNTYKNEWILEQAFQRVTGYEFQEVYRTTRLYQPTELARVQADIQRTLRGEVVENEYQIVTKSGEQRWIYIKRFPVWDDTENRVVRYYGVAQDITERKQAEAALRQSEERYRIVSELISDYAYANSLTAEGEILPEWTTDSFYRLTGYTAGEIGVTFNLYHPDDVALVQQDFQRVLLGENTRGQYRIITKSGAERWVHIYRQPVWDDTENRVVRFYGVAQDITEHKQAEEALRQSEERYRIVSELISDYAYSYSVTSNGQMEYEWTTDSFYRLTGYTPEEIGNTLQLYHPEDEPLVLQDIQRTIAGEITQGEYRILTKNGGVRWVHIYRMPVWDDIQKRVVRFYGVAQDITERKQAEQHERELVIQQERLQLLEELMSDLSHDLKTPITTIGTYLYLLLVQTSPEKQRQYVQKLVFEVNRLTRMVDDILTMSRLDKATALPLMPVNLPHLVDEVLLRYQPLALEKNISLTSELAATLPPIPGHEIELNRVLSNLIENAIHYTLAGGAVAVQVKKQDSEMVIEISDTGIGISPEDLPHIFERFYRSDKARSTDKGGTGLGLSIVKKIVETHHGRIEVQSETGVGSFFRIFLPM